MIKQTKVLEIAQAIKNAKEKNQAFLINKYRNDPRAGIQKEIDNALKKKDSKKRLKKDYYDLSRFERSFHQKGVNLIAGVDEAGRGPLAGPLVASAVILPQDCYIEGLKECKQLLADKRELIYEEIIKKAVSYSVFEVSSEEIDNIGLHVANLKALSEAALKLGKKPDFVFSDGFKVDIAIPNLKILKGDTVSVSIAAASVIAKVHRDRLMEQFHKIYPVYGFDNNKGYATKEHREALERFGPSEIHRQTFEPVRLCQEEKLKL